LGESISVTSRREIGDHREDHLGLISSSTASDCNRGWSGGSLQRHTCCTEEATVAVVFSIIN